MKYRVTHIVHFIAYTGKYTYYSVNKEGTVEYVFAQCLEYVRNYYLQHVILPF